MSTAWIAAPARRNSSSICSTTLCERVSPKRASESMSQTRPSSPARLMVSIEAVSWVP